MTDNVRWLFWDHLNRACLIHPLDSATNTAMGKPKKLSIDLKEPTLYHTAVVGGWSGFIVGIKSAELWHQIWGSHPDSSMFKLVLYKRTSYCSKNLTSYVELFMHETEHDARQNLFQVLPGPKHNNISWIMQESLNRQAYCKKFGRKQIRHIISEHVTATFSINIFASCQVL